MPDAEKKWDFTLARQPSAGMTEGSANVACTLTLLVAARLGDLSRKKAGEV